MIDINLYDFHDKELKSIFINSNTDFMDEIIIHIVDENEMKLELKCIRCSSCNILGNGWIVRADTIGYWCIKSGKDIQDMLPSFMPDEFRDKMQYLMLNLNTSNSVIEIIALDITLNYV